MNLRACRITRCLTLLCCTTLLSLGCASGPARSVRHYTFFGQDRERLKEDSAFVDTKQLEGAQVSYSWRQLEPAKDEYDFTAVREDLAFLTSRGKRLFIQLQDVTFSPTRINVPGYLLEDPRYNGGPDKQYRIPGNDEARAVHEGWMARRWDPAVQERWHQLLVALGKEFDGRVEGINFAETSSVFGESGRLFPTGFSFEGYRDAIITNMRALRQAFPRSVVMQYANFMPGVWRPTDDKGYLRAVYEAAKEMNVGVGGPDPLPFRPGQLGSSYRSSGTPPELFRSASRFRMETSRIGILRQANANASRNGGVRNRLLEGRLYFLGNRGAVLLDGRHPVSPGDTLPLRVGHRTQVGAR